MAKDKKGSKVAAPAPKPAASKPIESVKAGRVAKPESSKKTAKDVAKKVDKKSKKSKKEPTPEPSSDSEADTSESSVSSDEEMTDTKALPKANGSAKAGAAKDASDSDESSDSDAAALKKADAPKLNGAAKVEADDESSSASSDEEEAAPKTNGKVAAMADSDEGSDSESDDSDESSEASDSDSDVEEAEAGSKIPNANTPSEDDSSSASSDDEDEAPKAKAKAGADDSSAASSDEDSDDEDEEEVPKVEEKSNKKRKAEEPIAQTPKKTKVNVDGEMKDATGNLFIGGLSWNVDEEWLTREFEEFGELNGVRVITDRETGKSKGFGYVEFINTSDAITALEAKNGADLDGRNIRVDFSQPREKRTDGQTPQQRGSERAQRYGDVPKEPSATLFVGNISFNADESMLTEVFQDFGTIKGIRLPTDRDTGDFKGFGYVEMGSIDEAKAAFEGLQGADVGGRPVRLDYSTPKPQNDSAGGRGGFGGRGGGRGRGGFSDRGGGRGRGRGGFNDRGGRGGGRGGSRGGSSFNRGGFGDFSGKKKTFE
ncbi:nuclear localization sequence binding protein [Vermiconidia calcicola]|uniref:Nuclear localization sequence binding protein n=1 Tax=Vermiconidia calcicola TaxID=1690605 RepID=A0ACC3MV28_9PEZI|nr:nuclear localization sequence binding protein [Vermiconidia calcicola]